MSLSVRPAGQDIISHPSPLSQDPPLKQEDTQGNGSLLQEGREDSDHEGDQDDSEEGEGEGDGDDEEHSDPDPAEQDHHRHPRRGERTRTTRNGRGRIMTAKREPNHDDGDMSLSSDNDDDEETASVHPNDEEYSNMLEETVCRWKDCGKVLPSLADLVLHLSDEHIGWKKTSYTCEWQGCSRRPIAQTTRFALISHMRSHTKHKPYDCPVPECDKSFSRSDAMAKHLKCQHGDVPERFTGRKSRGRYTMKDPAASATLLPSSSFGAKKRRHHDSSRSDAETSSLPKKLRKLGTEFEGDHRHYHPKIPDSQLLFQLDAKRATRHGQGQGQGQGQGKDRRLKNGGGRGRGAGAGLEEASEEAEDSDFEVENGQTARQRYGILKAKFRYISNERESLESEYEELKKKLTRLRVERELLLDALLVSDDKFQDPVFQSIDDSD